jgi:hypothetical protein
MPGKRSTEEEWARTVRQLDLGRGTYEAISKNLERMCRGNIFWHRLYCQPSNSFKGSGPTYQNQGRVR